MNTFCNKCYLQTKYKKNEFSRRNNQCVFRELNKDLDIIGLGIFGSLNIAETGPNSVSNDFEIKFHQHKPIINDNVERSLFFKDKAFITDKSYHLFRKGMKLADRTSSLHSIKKRRKIKASTMGIMSLDRGYYRDPVRMIKQRVAKYIKTLGEGDCLDLVKIKLGCDGTNLSRNVKLVNFVFSVINEKVNAASVNGCNRIGIFQIEKEDYESTKKWLPVLWDKIKVLKKVFYDKVDKKILDESELNCIVGDRTANRFMKLDINYSFCNDMKMNLILLGLKAANSNWPCLYCTVSKHNLNERGNFHLYLLMKKLIVFQQFY
jgi:hypothetical protein